MDDSCLICAEDFNRTKHAPISCQYCSFTACSTCCQRYMLDQEANVCMNKSKKADNTFICQKEWTRKFVVDNFPKTWVNNTWKDMNAKVGVEREKALFPATMGIIEERKAKDKIKQQLNNINSEIKRLRRNKHNFEIMLRNGGDVVASKSVSIGRKCPDSECRGYLSTQWKCGVCEKWACSECHVIKGIRRDSEHTCDPDTRATAQLLAKDTKPCPKCHTPIHKIEGCDQMWCTQCQTGLVGNVVLLRIVFIILITMNGNVVIITDKMPLVI